MHSSPNMAHGISISRRSKVSNLAIAIVILVLELVATYASLSGEPLNPVKGWSVTRGTDWVAFAAVMVGCSALFWRQLQPGFALLVAGASYCFYIIRDYELGLFLPAMILLYMSIAHGYSRLWAISTAVACLAVSLYWVLERTAFIEEGGVALLARVAFGSVFTIFFFVPILIGEIVRIRRLYSNHKTG